MEKIGIIKEFDKLGRIVIPKDLRQRYGMNNKIEIVAIKEGLLIRNPQYELIKIQTES